MSAPQPSSLRMTFWVCWAGTVLFFIVTPYAEIFFKAGFNPPGYLFVTMLVMGLCFTSAACVTRYPRMALLGAVTLVCPVILLFLAALCLRLFK